MPVTTTFILPPEITQKFNRNLLLSAIERIYLNLNNFKLKSCKKYPNGCKKRQECLKVVQIMEKLHEWKTAKEEKEKREIMERLINEYADERGKLRKIIHELSEIIQL